MLDNCKGKFIFPKCQPVFFREKSQIPNKQLHLRKISENRELSPESGVSELERERKNQICEKRFVKNYPAKITPKIFPGGLNTNTYLLRNCLPNKHLLINTNNRIKLRKYRKYFWILRRPVLPRDRYL